MFVTIKSYKVFRRGEKHAQKCASVKDGNVRQIFFQLFIYFLTNQFAEVQFKYAIKLRDLTLNVKVLLLPIELCKNRQKGHLC